MKVEKKKHILKTSLRAGGTALILVLALLATFQLYQNDVNKEVYMNNYTTSVLFSDSLSTASGAAPWALLSLNWFVCRAAVKRWLSFVTKRFE
jgi:hypothetical protein